MNLANYKTSRDYALLWELAQENNIVCFVDYDTDIVDVCETLWNGSSVQLSVRGFSYIYTRSKDAFVDICTSKNLQWIIPVDIDKSCPLYADYKESCEALKARRKEIETCKNCANNTAADPSDCLSCDGDLSNWKPIQESEG